MTSTEIEIKEFPDNSLSGRLKLAYGWLSGYAENLLDAGCSYGYGTRYLKEKSKNTFAIDMDELHIEIASKRYKGIDFSVRSVENTMFPDNFFDEIVILDVLEHTSDKIRTLSEMYRILKPGGTVIISTPNRGIFGCLDPYNYGYNFRKYLPFAYKTLYKAIRLVKEKKIPTEFNPLHEVRHEHYSLKDLTNMLARSDFKEKFQVEKVFRSGLLIEVLTMNLEVIFDIFLSRNIVRALLKPLTMLSNLDYNIPYGALAYNIAIKVKKL